MTTKYTLALLAAGSTVFLACLAEPELPGDEAAHVASAVSGEPIDPKPGEPIDPKPGEPGEPVEPIEAIAHKPIGNAVLFEEDGVLHATNLRSLKDGVRSIPEERGVEWILEPEWSPEVTAINLAAVNYDLPGAGVEGSMRFERVGGSEWRVNATFPQQDDGAVRSSATDPGAGLPYRINVYLEGSLVGSFRVVPGKTDIRILHDDTDTCPLCEWLARRNSDGLQRYAWKLRATSGVITTVVDGESVTGDLIEFVEDKQHEFRGGFDEVELRSDADVTYRSETFFGR